MTNRNPHKSHEFDGKRASVNTRCRFPDNFADTHRRFKARSIVIDDLREQEY